MKRALLATGILLVAAAVGIYVGVVRPLLAPAEATPTVEAALATPEVVLMAGVNVKQAVFVERWLLGAPVATAAQETPVRAPLERSLLEHMRADGIHVRRDLDYALYALYRAPGAELRHAVVLVGRFDPAAVEGYLSRELHGTPRTVAGRLSHEITVVSPADCRPAGAWIVTADRSWILIADPASHAAILSRLLGQVSGESAQLAWWRSLARTDLMAVGLWNVKDTEQAVPPPLRQGMASTLSQEAGAFAHFYLGLGAQTVPPQGRLRLVLDAADAAAATQKIAGWRQALSQSRAQWSRTVPTVATLYDSLALRSDGARSTVEFTVDRTLAKNLQGVVNELLSALLAGFGGRPAPPSAPTTERVDTDPVVFQGTASASAIGAYDPRAQFAEDVDQIQGPFGVRVSEVRLGSSDDSGLEMLVEGFADRIPNVTTDGRGVLLFVDRVTSSAGQELLRSEPCGRERNDRPSSFTTSLAHRMKAAKTVRLVPGAGPHQIGSVAGRVELRLPTRTETVTLARPGPGTKAERYGATFVVTDVNGGTIAYQILGARDRVLHFRALNASGQPLSSGSAFFADLLFGDGVVGQKEYAGVVDRIDVVFAAEEETLRFPFTLNDFSPTSTSSMVARDTTPPFQPYGYQALRRDHPRLPGPGQPGALASAQLDPFELVLKKTTPYFGTTLEFNFRSPVIPNFERAFTVGRLRLTRVELRDGTRLEPAPGTPPKAMTIAPVWDAPIRFGTTPKDGALTTSLRLFLDTKFEAKDIKALRGVVTVEFPRALQTLQLADLSPGQRAALGDFSVKVMARGRKSLTLRANKDGDRLLYTRITGTDGGPIAFFSPQVTVSPDGLWQFEIAPLGAPAAAELIVAAERDVKTYPFALVPSP